MLKRNFKTEGGYTIIETMIAISLFIIIVMAGMGALLNANLLYQKSQSMRSIIDNLNFVMEDMSRNLRTGYNYRCITNNSDLSSTDTLATPQSGQDCWGIAFEYQNGTPYEYNSSGVLINKHGEDQWVYYIGPDTSLPGNPLAVWKATIGPYNLTTSFVKLTSNEVVINQSDVFTVLGAEKGGPQQPFVTIKLVGAINFKNVETPFSLQTSVSQRQIDI